MRRFLGGLQKAMRGILLCGVVIGLLLTLGGHNVDLFTGMMVGLMLGFPAWWIYRVLRFAIMPRNY